MGVDVEELRPNDTYVRRVLAAAYDIRLCELTFDGWMTQLNKCAASRLSQTRGPFKFTDNNCGVQCYERL